MICEKQSTACGKHKKQEQTAKSTQNDMDDLSASETVGDKLRRYLPFTFLNMAAYQKWSG
jgi:hypothetical protein